MIDVQVNGMAQIIKQLDPKKARAAMVRGMSKSGKDTEGTVKMATPVDTGRLRQSVTSEVRQDGSGVTLVMGSNVEYAKPVEYGAGRLSDAPDSSGNAFFPPPSALAGWAKRHGNLNPFLVARAIFARGGLRPRRMFRSVMESRFFGTVVSTRVLGELRKALGG